MRKRDSFARRRQGIGTEKVKENNVAFVRLWFTDILGNLKNFAITSRELETALERGMGFDGSSV